MAAKLLRITQVSERTGIPENTLRHYRATKQGPHSAIIAGRICYREEDVERWLDEQFERTANA